MIDAWVAMALPARAHIARPRPVRLGATTKLRGGVGSLHSRKRPTFVAFELLCYMTAVARPTKAGLSHGRGTAASFVRHGRPESAGTASEAVHGERQGLCGAAKRAEFSRSSIAGVRRSLLAGYLLGGVPRAYYVTV